MPAFYSSTSGLPVDVRCDTPEEVAALARARDELGLRQSLLVAVPPPEEAEIPASEIEPVIEQAVAVSQEKGLTSADVTPYLLQRLGELTAGRSLRTNLALLENNARVASQIANSMTAMSNDRKQQTQD